MDSIGIVGVGAITVICYLGAMVTKATSLDDKWIPVVCGILGAVLGVVSLYVMPDFPASDVVTAIAVGAASGLAATGINQIYKQFNKKKETIVEE